MMFTYITVPLSQSLGRIFSQIASSRPAQPVDCRNLVSQRIVTLYNIWIDVSLPPSSVISVMHSLTDAQDLTQWQAHRRRGRVYARTIDLLSIAKLPASDSSCSPRPLAGTPSTFTRETLK